VVGDFGTNDTHYLAVLKGIDSLKPDFIIHLGDIYTSGTKKECKAFWKMYNATFTAPIPPLWAIPGNK
jgi:predicted phosphodiesterase